MRADFSPATPDHRYLLRAKKHSKIRNTHQPTATIMKKLLLLFLPTLLFSACAQYSLSEDEKAVWADSVLDATWQHLANYDTIASVDELTQVIDHYKQQGQWRELADAWRAASVIYDRHDMQEARIKAMRQSVAAIDTLDADCDNRLVALYYRDLALAYANLVHFEKPKFLAAIRRAEHFARKAGDALLEREMQLEYYTHYPFEGQFYYSDERCTFDEVCLDSVLSLREYFMAHHDERLTTHAELLLLQQSKHWQRTHDADARLAMLDRYSRHTDHDLVHPMSYAAVQYWDAMGYAYMEKDEVDSARYCFNQIPEKGGPMNIYETMRTYRDLGLYNRRSHVLNSETGQYLATNATITSARNNIEAMTHYHDSVLSTRPQTFRDTQQEPSIKSLWRMLWK